MKKALLAPLLFATAISPAYAQVQPDAGRVINEQKPGLEAPKASPDFSLGSDQEVSRQEPGGAKIALKAILFRDNTVFSQEELQTTVSDALGQSYDLAGLKALAARITNFYREAGYPFARALVPQQQIENDTVTIQIIEGRYGKIKAAGDEDLIDDALDFLSSMHEGDVIESADLERATLILDDQPGVKATPIIRPGQDVGTGDLNVKVSKKPAVSGELGFDNNGNRYSGEYRGRLSAQIDSPFLFGDQIQLQTIITDENLWLGSLGYNLPIGTSGLRAQIGYSQTTYELGKQFENLDATGSAKISTIGLSYPLFRSQAANLSVLGQFQHKDLEDKQGAAATRDTKTSDSTPLSAQFDVRDNLLLAGAVTYGSLGWTHGHLNLGASLNSTDTLTAKTDGGFNKFNADVARIQRLLKNVSLYGHFAAQWTNDNLDSSEGFGLGGPNGVRAYPVGEAYGDRGWLSQVELRYEIDAFTPYAFYDSGDVTVNADPWAPAVNDRNIAGAGFGVRFAMDWFSLDTSLAWKTQGGKPESDSADKVPQVWVAASAKF